MNETILDFLIDRYILVYKHTGDSLRITNGLCAIQFTWSSVHMSLIGYFLLQMKLNIGTHSNKQNFITWDQFIGGNGRGCLSNIKVYIGMKVIVTRCTLGTDVHLLVASLWTNN